MKRITEYRNIVFDMGGVLVDYTADNATWHFTDDPEIVREIRQCDLLPGMNFEASKEATDTEDCAIKRRQADIFHCLLQGTIEHSNPENLIDTPMLA